MSDYISRQVAIDAMRYISDSICEQQAVDALNELPSADVQPVRHGKWKETEFLKLRECSCCTARWGIYSIEEFEFCPSCGARMDGEQNE